MRRIIMVTAAVLAAAVLTGGAARAAAGPAAGGGHRVIREFSYAAGQTPEALADGPRGSVYVSLSEASRVADVTPAGRLTVLAQLPHAGNCPVFKVPITTGIIAGPGVVDVLVCDGNAATGVWQLRAGHAPRQVTRLPAGAVPNGLTLRGGWLYAADSLLGVIWRSPAGGGPARVWASGPALTRISYIGLNGIYATPGAIWADNTDRGTVLRIPVRRDGTAGPARVMFSGLAAVGLDDFAVLPGGAVVMPEELAGRVVLLRSGRAPRTLLTAADGLRDPVDAWADGGILLVADSGYIDGQPNLLAAALPAGSRGTW